MSPPTFLVGVSETWYEAKDDDDTDGQRLVRQTSQPSIPEKGSGTAERANNTNSQVVSLCENDWVSVEQQVNASSPHNSARTHDIAGGTTILPINELKTHQLVSVRQDITDQTYTLVDGNSNQHRLRKKDLEWFPKDVLHPLHKWDIPVLYNGVVTLVAGFPSLPLSSQRR